MQFYEKFVEYFELIVNYAVIVAEIVGVCILLYAVGRGLVEMFGKKAGFRIRFAENMLLALQFLIGGEILKTVTACTWTDVGIIGGIIVLRVALAIVLQRDVKLEKRDQAEEQKIEEKAE